MSETEPLEYLSNLDDSILEQFVRIVRLAADMSDDEKTNVRNHIAIQVAMLAIAGPGDAQVCAHLLAALGLVVTSIDEAARAGAAA